MSWLFLTRCETCGHAIFWVTDPLGGWWAHINIRRNDHSPKTDRRVVEEYNAMGNRVVVAWEQAGEAA